MHDFDPGLLPYTLPFTLGHENTGIVESLGAGVQHLAPGEPVAVYGPGGCGRCWRCHQGMENYCERSVALGGGRGRPRLRRRDGSPHARTPGWLLPLDDLDPVEAAPLTDAGLTPYHASKRSLHLLHGGSTAVVIGAGGLGHLAIQILKATGPVTCGQEDRPDRYSRHRSRQRSYGCPQPNRAGSRPPGVRLAVRHPWRQATMEARSECR